MDKLFSQVNKASGEGAKANPGDHKQQASSTDLLSSAKVVADAAKTAASQGFDKVDKGKAAGSAADLLDAGSKYGKLQEDKGVGQYVQKAEDYLHQYGAKNTTGHGHAPPAAGHAPPAEQHHDAAAGGDHEKKQSEEGGVGGYMKMAQGFLQK